ncbi:hypothetical protein GWI33_009035 [Rhynchophorus ferrugineus]|uniref:Uncharacterized protein n=1 Tax=Rhynchophorus ferrugineus TaxID=354439 RepID=A0A834MBT4_RHYFE|nr:hypothetical protein GWI33_009035 [Rhynchophorus ferrugineus]
MDDDHARGKRRFPEAASAARRPLDGLHLTPETNDCGYGDLVFILNTDRQRKSRRSWRGAKGVAAGGVEGRGCAILIIPDVSAGAGWLRAEGRTSIARRY